MAFLDDIRLLTSFGIGLFPTNTGVWISVDMKNIEIIHSNVYIYCIQTNVYKPFKTKNMLD